MEQYKELLDQAEQFVQDIRNKLKKILPKAEKHPDGWERHNSSYRACASLRLALTEAKTALLWVQSAAMEDGSPEDIERSRALPTNHIEVIALIDKKKHEMKKRIREEEQLSNSVSGDTDESFVR
mgnify:CR=1 FL=1|jgi:hypothetical protein